MDKEYQVVYSLESTNDLKGIYDYISDNLMAPSTAYNQIKRIRNNIQKLKNMPHRFPLVQWDPWNSLNTRKMKVDNFVVFYIIDKENHIVSVLRIIYGGRDIADIITD